MMNRCGVGAGRACDNDSPVVRVASDDCYVCKIHVMPKSEWAHTCQRLKFHFFFRRPLLLTSWYIRFSYIFSDSDIVVVHTIRWSLETIDLSIYRGRSNWKKGSHPNSLPYLHAAWRKRPSGLPSYDLSWSLGRVSWENVVHHLAILGQD